VFLLELLQLVIVDILKHLALNLFLLLGELNDQLVLLSDLLEVFLDLLVDALIRGLSHCVLELSHLYNKFVLP